MARFLLAFCCAIFQVVLSSMYEAAKGIRILALQSSSEATDNYNVEKYDSMDYKTAMGFALDDTNEQDRFVKINIRGELASLPTIGSNDSSAKDFEKMLNSNPQYSVRRVI